MVLMVMNRSVRLNESHPVYKGLFSEDIPLAVINTGPADVRFVLAL
jgi:hypothetical protein